MVTPTESIAFLFPGQGSQAVGMGRALSETYPIAADTFQEADDLLGFPLSELCWDGPERELKDTINTQPALLTHSIAVLRVLNKRFPELQAKYAAGHSMGEFAALVAAGAITFKDGLNCVRERGRLMKEAGEKNPGGMSAVLGLDFERVEEICKKVSGESEGSVWVANDNCPGQVVISGEVAGLERAETELSGAGARKVVRLAVSIPSHCPLMAEAQEKFNRVLDATPFEKPKFPVVGNVNASLMQTVDEIKADLGAQLISPVRWTESMQSLLANSVNRCYEIGSGKVLTGLMRRIDRSISTSPIDTPTDLSSLFDRLSEEG
jgi:[acyl-carrier-protein] S-malonyltransferase